jgi:hypothetical protein
MEKSALAVGVRLKEVVTKDVHYQDCRVLNADGIGLVFETERTVSEGGNVETVISQVLIPWAHIHYIIVMEERS